MYLYLFIGKWHVLKPVSWTTPGTPGRMLGWFKLRMHITKQGCMHCMEEGRLELSI